MVAGLVDRPVKPVAEHLIRHRTSRADAGIIVEKEISNCKKHGRSRKCTLLRP
jgi:hypothetical protein